MCHIWWAAPKELQKVLDTGMQKTPRDLEQHDVQEEKI